MPGMNGYHHYPPVSPLQGFGGFLDTVKRTLDPRKAVKRGTKVHRKIVKRTVPKVAQKAAVKIGKRLSGREGWAAFGKKAGSVVAGFAVGGPVGAGVVLGSQYAKGRINRDLYRKLKAEAEKMAKAEGKQAKFYEGLKRGRQKAAADKAKAAAAKVKTAAPSRAMAVTAPTGGMAPKWGPFAVLGGIAVIGGLAVWGIARRRR